MPESDRPQVFVSYSKKDGIEWVEGLEYHCDSYKKHYLLRYDKHIEDGANWRDWIRIALAKMHVAVLLVGPGFLSSPFIQEEELPRLLEAHRRGKRLFILVVRHCEYEHPVNPLGKLQASNEPNNPLEELSEAKRNKIYKSVARKIFEVVKEFIPSPESSLLPSDALQYHRNAFPVAVKKHGKPKRHIVVRKLVQPTSASPGAKLVLNWRTIGDGVDFLLHQLRSHTPEKVPDLCVGVNGFGLALAGFLAGVLFGRSVVG